MQGKNSTRKENEWKREERSSTNSSSPEPLGSCYQSMTFDRIRRGVSTSVAEARTKNALLLSGAGVAAGS
ncbi:unnamed protein product [Linum trigynum]|uniref:Uncharacterized protein n=1 Tax=Linum trigynum TaxID=586398 RepID=A0AAV2E6D3_9ROSI